VLLLLFATYLQTPATAGVFCLSEPGFTDCWIIGKKTDLQLNRQENKSIEFSIPPSPLERD